MPLSFIQSPAALDCELKAGAVFGRAAPELGHERPVDLLDVVRPSCTKHQKSQRDRNGSSIETIPEIEAQLQRKDTAMRKMTTITLAMFFALGSTVALAQSGAGGGSGGAAGGGGTGASSGASGTGMGGASGTSGSTGSAAGASGTTGSAAGTGAGFSGVSGGSGGSYEGGPVTQPSNVASSRPPPVHRPRSGHPAARLGLV